MKPFMKYPGGKGKETAVVNKYKPKEINRYFEPFLGGGAIYFDLDIQNSYINDYSKDLILLYRFVKEKNIRLKEYLDDFNMLWCEIEKEFENLSDICNLDYVDELKYQKYFQMSLKRKNKLIDKIAKNNKTITEENKDILHTTAKKTAVYMLIRDIYNQYSKNKELHIAAYYFLREYCYSSMFRFSKNGDFNVPYGGISYNCKYLTEKINYMFSSQMAEKLSNTEIYNVDFQAFLNMFNLCENDFIFLDPPYDSDFSTYDKKEFDKEEQKRLKNVLANTSARWMLIIKKTDFIEELYQDYYIYEYNKNYMVSFKNRNDKEVKHLLITNYLIQEAQL